MYRLVVVLVLGLSVLLVACGEDPQEEDVVKCGETEVKCLDKVGGDLICVRSYDFAFDRGNPAPTLYSMEKSNKCYERNPPSRRTCEWYLICAESAENEVYGSSGG